MYIYDYKFQGSHLVDPTRNIPASKLAALFTAAKKGNPVECKKLHQEECERILSCSDKTTVSHVFYTDVRDRSGYRYYDWLYKNRHQPILNNTFAERDPNLSKQDEFRLAILCNQESYLAEHAEEFSDLTPDFLSAAQLGSPGLMKLLFEKFEMPETAIFEILMAAADFGYADIVEFVYAKIKGNKGHHEKMMRLAFEHAIINEHPEVVEKLSSICKKDELDINHIPPASFANYCKNSTLACAAEQEDPTYVKIILKAGANPIPDYDSKAGFFNPQTSLYSPIECSVYKEFYETLLVLLQGGAAFHDYDYLRVKDWMNDTHNNQKRGVERPETPKEISPRIKSLVALMLYKHEIKAQPAAISTTELPFLRGVFHAAKSSQDNAVQLKACEVLFDVIIRKRPLADLDRLSPLEKGALENKESPLASIYQNLFDEIEKIKEEEASAQVHPSVNFNG